MDVWSIQQHTHDKRQRHILLPTPTVRGHAEACPSTTYAKYPLPTRALTLGGHEYTLPEYLRGGGGAPSPSLLSDIYLE